MFFCRHHLLRAPAQRHFTSLVTTRNALARAVPPNPHSRPGYARFSHTPTLPVSPNAPPATASDPDVTSLQPIPGDLDISSKPSALDSQTNSSPAGETEKEDDAERRHAVDLPSTSNPEEVAAFKKQFSKDPLGIYLAVRSGGVDAITTFSSEFFAGALWRCIHEEKQEHLPTLVHDAIVILDERAGKIRGRKVMEILISTLNHKRLLRKEDVLALLRCLDRNGQLRFLSSATRATLARAIVLYAPDSLDREIMDLLVPLLLAKLPSLGDRKLASQRWASTEELDSTNSGIAVPRILWPLFRIAVRLATLGDKKASDILAALVQRDLIPSQAIEDTDLTSKDLVYVMLSVLLRSCLTYSWFSRATALLFSVVPTMDTLSPPYTSLVEDWLTRALAFPRQQDIQQASSAIMLLFQRAPGYVLPTEILQRFYQGAFECDTPELAETIYRLSRKVRHCSYPPPRDAALIRLMTFLGTKSRDVHLARLLAQQVVDEDIPLSVPARGPFIVQTAVLGFASHARALWERYSVGRDAQFLVGSGQVMVRMVSLFAHVADETKAAAQRKRPDVSGTHRENLEDSASRDDQDGTQPTSPRTLSQDQDLPASDAPPSPATPPPHQEPSEGGEPPPSDGSAASARTEDGLDDRFARGFDALTYPELLAREADLRAFAVRVYDAYRRAKLPLERATHHDLTSLSRAASILRRDDESLDVFVLLKKRGVAMDLHDINLALAMVSRNDPAAGAQYIQRIVASGIKPDAVSFGTVIHWAAQRGDAALVRSLIQQAKDAGIEELSFKTLSSLLHATVAGKVSEETSPAAQLQHAEDIVDIMLSKGTRPTPNIAKDCVVAALRADDPEKAFDFWRLYIKGKVEAQDLKQQRLRRTIARLVQDHLHKGWLSPEKSMAMLYDLGYPNDAFLQARNRHTQPSPAELETNAEGARKG